MRKYRKYVFAVVFLRKEYPQFLVLHRTKNWTGWEMVKGGLKTGEDELKGLGREIKEETGTTFKVIAKTRHFIKYAFPRGFVKDGHLFYGAKGYLFLVEAFGRGVKIDKGEHDRCRWVGKDEAMKLITHKNHKNALDYVCKRYKLC